MSSYPGNTHIISTVFRDEEGTPVAVSGVKLIIETPDGTETELDDLTNTGTGAYEKAYVPATHGRHWAKWKAANPEIANEKPFDVKKSRFST